MSAHPLPGVFEDLAPLLDNYGYLAVAGLLFLENLGSPVALGETIFIGGAIYAGAGRLNIFVLCAVGIAASVAGGGAGYAIGWYGGRALVLRYGRFVGLNSERLAKAEKFFLKHGALLLTVARFLEGVRQANGIISGITKMPLLRFLVYNTLGAILWIGVWGAIGDLAGDHITPIYQQITRYSLYLLIVIVLAVIVLIVRYVVRRRRKRADADGAATADGDVPQD
ncbi:MAG TPA: DedA family protein [Streptosporangiaceae bacterium]|jgi:membrane protein DedA with SNARE-associated domain